MVFNNTCCHVRREHETVSVSVLLKTKKTSPTNMNVMHVAVRVTPTGHDRGGRVPETASVLGLHGQIQVVRWRRCHGNSVFRAQVDGASREDPFSDPQNEQNEGRGHPILVSTPARCDVNRRKAKTWTCGRVRIINNKKARRSTDLVVCWYFLGCSSGARVKVSRLISASSFFCFCVPCLDIDGRPLRDHGRFRLRERDLRCDRVFLRRLYSAPENNLLSFFLGCAFRRRQHQPQSSSTRLTAYDWSKHHLGSGAMCVCY